MFGQRASNDNFTKESDIISGSFIASATNTITQLNTQLAKLQESSKAIVKSMIDAVNKIKMVDRDMSQRFKKLNADITASRPDFGKFLYKAPPLPLAEIAPGSIQQGKLANTAGLVPPGGGGGGGPLEKILEAAAAAAGLGAGAAGARATPRATTTQTPKTPTTTETPKAATPKAPAGTPEVKPSTSVPQAGSRTGAPTAVESPPKAPAAGEPARVGEGKELRKTAIARIGKLLPVGITAVFTIKDSYQGYKEAEDAYDAAIASGVSKEEATKQFYAAMTALVGEQLGSFFGGLGGAKLGAVAASVGGPLGTLAGGLGGAIIGSALGADLGKISGEALSDSVMNGTSFTENFNTRAGDLLKQKELAAKEEEKRRLEQAGPSQRQRTRKTLDSLGQTPADQKQGATAAPATPPPASPPGGAEAGEEGGERGTTSAPTGEATPDKTNVTGAPSAAGPTPTTPSAPPPAPRPNQGAGGADVIVNKTTNMSSSSSSGEGQNVTNPNMKMDAHNPFIKDSLARQVLPEHN
jgi:hypothetical protein